MNDIVLGWGGLFVAGVGLAYLILWQNEGRALYWILGVAFSALGHTGIGTALKHAEEENGL